MILALVPLDWIVVATYGVVVISIGYVANRRQRGSEDYFLGGRRLPWWVVGISLVATSFSSASLIGGTGFGYAVGMQWLQLQIGDLVAVLVVCAVFLPFFSGLRLTTAYEYLERRFGLVARTVASAMFLGQTLLRAAILVYGPALALARVLGWSIESSILASAAAAICYSAFGGIGAVVWTDLIQFAVILFAVAYCLVLVAGDVPGGFDAVLDHARSRGALEVVTLEADPGTPFNLLGTLVPYAVLALSLFGTGQQAVQRFLSCRDLASARRAALTGWVAGTIALGITLFLGVTLGAWADLAPDAPSMEGLKSDQILPHFIDARLPAGVAGLMLAAIFAASMSSLDSAIHSMSTAGIVDFLRRFARSKPDERTELRFARIATVAFGVVATLGALAAARTETTLLETLVRWLGYFAGPLLGLFLLGMLTVRANEFGALLGTLWSFVAVLVAAALWRKEWGIHPLWLAPLSCMSTFLLGWISSLMGSAPPPSRIAGLTVTTRTPSA